MRSNKNNTLLKISARAFTNPFLNSKSSSTSQLVSRNNKKGGNPVTIFHFSKQKQHSIPNSKLRSYLAKTCSWESVISYSGYSYANHKKSNNYGVSVGVKHRIWFYMPSGEEVSYCAHAAMAACSIINNVEGESSEGKLKFLSGIIDDGKEEDTENNSDCILIENTARVCIHIPDQHQLDHTGTDITKQSVNNEVTLQMDGKLHEKEVPLETTLKLLEQVGLSYDDVLVEGKDDATSTKTPKYPTFINSSVARNKTLVALKSISTLHSAKNPPDPILFRDLCDEIDSTGLYLYAPISLASYECRQFPRFSGYPEDPATGIAAASLANSLFYRKIHDGYCETGEGTEEKLFHYEMFQGTAMQKPSKIKVTLQRNEADGDDSSNILYCSGVVEIDEIDEIELPNCFNLKKMKSNER